MKLRNQSAAAVAVISIALLAGCSQRQSQANVRASFPGAEIQPVPGTPYEWIIRESNVVLWVRDVGEMSKKVNRESGFVVEIFK